VLPSRFRQHQLLLTHNRFSLCKNDCLSPTGDATNEEYSYNVFDRPGQNCVGCGTGSAIESIAGPHRTYHYHHNYVTGEPAGGPFCLSIINGTAEVDHNYCGGNGAALEWDPHYAEGGGITRISIHRNYMDAVNIPGGASIFGPYGDSPGSVLADNRVLGGTDLSPVRHPGMSRVGWPFEPVRLGVATGRGA
jgi:hypothetical protein